MSNSTNVNWKVIYLPEAEKDLKKLDHTQQIEVLKAIKKVQQNPLPNYQGGYGKPLANRQNLNLSGYLKVKLKKSGLRIVYKLITVDENQMLIIIIGARDQSKVYKTAFERARKIG